MTPAGPDERLALGRRRRRQASAAPRRRLAVSTAIFGRGDRRSRACSASCARSSRRTTSAPTGKINAFTIAFQIPNLVRALVADAALSSSFVPVFIDLLEKDPKRAWRVASSLFWLMLLGLTALSALFILVAPWVIGVFGNPGHDRALAVGLSRVLFPIVALLGVSGIIVGILNSYDHFTVPAISPVFWNIAIIVGLAIGVPQAKTMNTKLYVYAVSILIATFIQVFLPLPWLRGCDGRLRLVLDWRDPAVKRVFMNMVPVTLGLGLINVNAVIDMFFASRLHRSEPRADRDPEGVPHLHAPAGDVLGRDRDGALPDAVAVRARGARERRLHRVPRAPSAPGLRQIAFLLVPAAVVSAVLAEPIVRLLFQRGQFLPNQTPVVAALSRRVQRRPRVQRRHADAQPRVLQPPLELDPDVDRARQPVPERASSTSRFYRVGIWGIPLATAICNIAGTWALLVVLRRRIRRVDGRRDRDDDDRVVVASAVVGAVAWTIWRPLDSALGRSFPAQLVSLGCALSAAVLVYFLCCRLLKVRELEALLSLRARFRV